MSVRALAFLAGALTIFNPRVVPVLPLLLAGAALQGRGGIVALGISSGASAWSWHS